MLRPHAEADLSNTWLCIVKTRLVDFMCAALKAAALLPMMWQRNIGKRCTNLLSACILK